MFACLKTAQPARHGFGVSLGSGVLYITSNSVSLHWETNPTTKFKLTWDTLAEDLPRGVRQDHPNSPISSRAEGGSGNSCNASPLTAMLRWSPDESLKAKFRYLSQLLDPIVPNVTIHFKYLRLGDKERGLKAFSITFDGK